MERPCAALEITNKSLKLLVGYEINGKVCAVYSLVKPLGEIKRNGEFLDFQKTIADLAPFNNIRDPNAKININIGDILLGLPPINFEVYQTRQNTTVVGEDEKVQDIDIKNLFNLARRATANYNTSNSLVDIIPEKYVLDQGRTFINPPKGQTTSSVTLFAHVHSLSRNVMEDYKKVVEGAGFSIRRSVVTPFAASELISSYPNTPKDYILVDIGARETVVSLVGNQMLYSSKIFQWGGDNITHKIEETFNISEAEAEKLKIMYGIDKRELNFKAPICTYADENGNEVKHYPDELNKIIKGELDIFIEGLKKEINNLLADYDPRYKKLKMLLVGGGSLLKGLVEYVSPKVDSSELSVIIPDTLGCRNPAFINLIGMIYVQGKYQISSEDQKTKVSSVNRNSR